MLDYNKAFNEKEIIVKKLQILACFALSAALMFAGCSKKEEAVSNEVTAETPAETASEETPAPVTEEEIPEEAEESDGMKNPISGQVESPTLEVPETFPVDKLPVIEGATIVESDQELMTPTDGVELQVVTFITDKSMDDVKAFYNPYLEAIGEFAETEVSGAYSAVSKESDNAAYTITAALNPTGEGVIVALVESKVAG